MIEEQNNHIRRGDETELMSVLIVLPCWECPLLLPLTPTVHTHLHTSCKDISFLRYLPFTSVYLGTPIVLLSTLLPHLRPQGSPGVDSSLLLPYVTSPPWHPAALGCSSPASCFIPADQHQPGDHILFFLLWFLPTSIFLHSGRFHSRVEVHRTPHPCLQREMHACSLEDPRIKTFIFQIAVTKSP